MTISNSRDIPGFNRFPLRIKKREMRIYRRSKKKLQKVDFEEFNLVRALPESITFLHCVCIQFCFEHNLLFLLRVAQLVAASHPGCEKIERE